MKPGWPSGQIGLGTPGSCAQVSDRRERKGPAGGPGRWEQCPCTAWCRPGGHGNGCEVGCVCTGCTENIHSQGSVSRTTPGESWDPMGWSSAPSHCVQGHITGTPHFPLQLCCFNCSALQLFAFHNSFERREDDSEETCVHCIGCSLFSKTA